MTNYRRATVPGGTYFFTVNLADRKLTTLVDRIDLLKHAIRQEVVAHPFRVDAFVVLPEHLHTIWILPAGEADFSSRWRRIKAEFSSALPGDEWRSASRRAKGERGVWQRRFWEHLIRDERDYARHVDYIHFNPVKHGHVTRARDWPHSTFHEWVRNGQYPLDWAGGEDIDLDAGE
ncbi:MAG: transposase [Gammaproteobacteria bacterium]|nr:transposase [Gammaproteobacteria bacterium]